MTQRARIQLRPKPQAEAAGEERQTDAAAHDRADRRDKRIIAGHFPKTTWAQLRALCIQEDKTSQELLEEALTDLFQKYRGR